LWHADGPKSGTCNLQLAVAALEFVGQQNPASRVNQPLPIDGPCQMGSLELREESSICGLKSIVYRLWSMAAASHACQKMSKVRMP